MEPETRPRTILALAGALIVAALGIGLVFTGGQVSTILSKVGSAIPGGAGVPESGGSGGGDTIGNGSDQDGTGNGSGGQVADLTAALPELLIIRTGELELVVGDVTAAARAGRDLVDRLGGYVGGSAESDVAAGGSARTSYRIPAAQWEATLDGLRGLAREVRRMEITTEAVTNQVVDLRARIANLRATETALQAIMAKATAIKDVLEVQTRLTDVRGQVERLVAEQEQLEDRAAYGTLVVTFALPPVPVAEEVAEGWNPATDVDEATGTLIGIGQRLTSMAIWLTIVGLPMLLGFAILVGVVRVGWILAGRRRAPEGA